MKKKNDFEELQKSLVESGRELYGPGYKIRAQGAPAKRVVQSTHTPLVTAQSGNSLSQVRVSDRLLRGSSNWGHGIVGQLKVCIQTGGRMVVSGKLVDC